MLTLIPVVDVPFERSEFWWPLPASLPVWPARIELSGQASEMDVALVAYQFAAYNARGSGAVLTPAELLAFDDRLMLPGGLLVRSGEREIAPSCCCGLESWPEWRHVADGHSPWMGHDPTAGVERIGDRWRLWPDFDTKLGTGSGEPIDFDLETLAAQLVRVEADLRAFTARFAEVVEAHVPACGAALAERFRSAFVDFQADI
jgi:hypothetical protein